MYDLNETCEYIISGGEETYIDITILTFHLYDGEDFTCRGPFLYDNVEIRDGDSEASPLIVKLCGRDKPISLHSTKNKIWIRYAIESHK